MPREEDIQRLSTGATFCRRST